MPPSSNRPRRKDSAGVVSAGHWMHQRDAHGGSGRKGLRGDRNMWFVTVKIGKHTKNHGKSRFLRGTSTIIGKMLGKCWDNNGLTMVLIKMMLVNNGDFYGLTWLTNGLTFVNNWMIMGYTPW